VPEVSTLSVTPVQKLLFIVLNLIVSLFSILCFQYRLVDLTDWFRGSGTKLQLQLQPYSPRCRFIAQAVADYPNTLFYGSGQSCISAFISVSAYSVHRDLNRKQSLYSSVYNFVYLDKLLSTFQKTINLFSIILRSLFSVLYYLSTILLILIIKLKYLIYLILNSDFLISV
jgi:hypothetical protein